jgi:hypothetical protein
MPYIDRRTRPKTIEDSCGEYLLDAIACIRDDRGAFALVWRRANQGVAGMSNAERKVRRTLHFRFTQTSADPTQILSFVNASKPFYEMLGGTEVRLLQNVDDPGKFIQVIEYETPESMEMNRSRIAGDMRLQTYLQAWRAMLPGGIEIDVFKDVEP